MPPKRYHKALVVLHWLLALLLVFALAMGTFVLTALPNTSPDKFGALQGHMIGGALILALTVLRLVVRLRTARPAPATTGNAWLDRLAPLTHWVLYGLVLVMAGSGIAMSAQANLPAIVFGGAGRLPESFGEFMPRAVHGVAATLLMLAIGLHVAAAVYHQFVRRDRLLSRMGFGPQ
jgi:cytochrome b561